VPAHETVGLSRRRPCLHLPADQFAVLKAAEESERDRRTSGDVMPTEGAEDSAMEYYSNAAIEKKAVANRFIGLRLILRVGWSMRASGHESR
jgi:hypothetical protein